MTLDQIMRVIAGIEDQAEFDRLWKMLGEIVYQVAKHRRDGGPAQSGSPGDTANGPPPVGATSLRPVAFSSSGSVDEERDSDES